MMGEALKTEMTLIKQGLRRAGLNPRGLATQDFHEMTVEQEKKWRNIRKQASTRAHQLQDMFPGAFGMYEQEAYNRQILADMTGRCML